MPQLSVSASHFSLQVCEHSQQECDLHLQQSNSKSKSVQRCNRKYPIDGSVDCAHGALYNMCVIQNSHALGIVLDLIVSDIALDCSIDVVVMKLMKTDVPGL